MHNWLSPVAHFPCLTLVSREGAEAREVPGSCFLRSHLTSDKHLLTPPCVRHHVEGRARGRKHRKAAAVGRVTWVL